MRTIATGSALWLLCFFSGLASASEARSLEKVKTGILPTGGFYSIYQVSCAGDSTATVGGLSRRGGPWCADDAGQLRCFRRSEDASQQACSAGTLVQRDSILVEQETYR